MVDLNEECDIRPEGTVCLAVRGGEADRRSWLAEAPVVPALKALGIAHAGVMGALPGYRIVRTKLSGAYFMVTLSGVGKVYLNGKWESCGEGQAVLLMPGVMNAFYAVEGGCWSHAWVRMGAGSGILSGSSARMQVVTDWEGKPMSHALLGLREAALAQVSPRLQQGWAELVWQSVDDFRHSFEPDPRVVRLWEVVESRLAESWGLDEMAAVAALSPEHLRRLCRVATGRAPHAHLMHLRMKRAAELLRTTTWTTERIAEEVGYANAFAFSVAFKKVIGWPPSTYGQRVKR